jgi:macrolide-specific efflux system membrane fusion protein
MTDMLRPVLPLTALLALLALAGCGLNEHRKGHAPAVPAASSAAMAKGFVDVAGGLVRIAAPRDGVITRILVEEGDAVAKGQPLAILDDRQAQLGLEAVRAEVADRRAQLAMAQAKAAGAARDAQRLAGLARQDAATRQDADQAGTAAAISAAERDQARQALAAAEVRARLDALEVEVRTLRAPAAGKIIRRSANAGAFVNAAAPLFLLEPTGARIVRAELDETFADQIHAGMRAKVTREFDATQAYDAHVLRVAEVFASPALNDDAAARSDSRVVAVVLTLDVPASMKLGQRVLVRFEK